LGVREKREERRERAEIKPPGEEDEEGELLLLRSFSSERAEANRRIVYKVNK
jgi:hypothetical protein